MGPDQKEPSDCPRAAFQERSHHLRLRERNDEGLDVVPLTAPSPTARINHIRTITATRHQRIWSVCERLLRSRRKSKQWVGAQPAPVADRKKGIPGQEAYDKHLIAAPIARLNSVVEWHTHQAAASAQTPQRSQRTGSSPFHAERRNTI